MALIPNEIIEEIKEKANIADLIGSYISIKRSGSNFSAVCPFHKEKTPSFMISPAKQIFHCFGCHVGGNVFSFVMEYDKLSFVDAVKKVAQYVGYDMSRIQYSSAPHNADKRDQLFLINQKAMQAYTKALFENADALSYFRQRKIDDKLIHDFSLGYASNNAQFISSLLSSDEKKYALESGLIMEGNGYFDRFRKRLLFPIFDVNHKVAGFGGRRIDENQNPKYLNSPDSIIYNKSNILYGLSHALDRIRKEKSCIFVEGYMDVLRCHQYDIKHVVATSGTALTASHARLISRYCQKVFLIFDSDSAGLNAMIRSIPILLSQGLDLLIVPMPKNHDPDSLLLEFGKEKFDEMLSRSVDYIDFQYRFYSKKGDLKQNSTTVPVIKQMLDHSNAIKDEFLKKLNKSRIANLFGMDQLSIESYQTKHQSYEDIEDDSEAKLQSIFADINQSKYHLEREILSIFLNIKPEQQNRLIRKLNPELFHNTHLKKLLIEILNHYDDHGSFSIEEMQKNDFLRVFYEQAQLKEYQNLDLQLEDLIYQLSIHAIDFEIKNLKEKLDHDSLQRIKALQEERQDLIQTAKH